MRARGTSQAAIQSGLAPNDAAAVEQRLAEVYAADARRIFRYCYLLLQNRADAEDITQETFLRAAKALPTLTGDASAYLTAVARNLCCDLKRSRRYATVPLDTAPLNEPGDEPDKLALDATVARDLWARLDSYEQNLVGQAFAGFSNVEIGARVGRSPGAVAVSLCRARQRMRSLARTAGAFVAMPAGFSLRLTRQLRRRAAPAHTGATPIGAGLGKLGLLGMTLAGGLALGSAAPSLPSTATGPGPAPHAVADGAAQLGVVAPAANPGREAGGAIHTRRATSVPSSEPLPVALARTAAGVIPGGQATTDDTYNWSLTPSPSYSSDHTVYASGMLFRGCVDATTCPALFVSRDGGRTWAHLPALNFRGGAILLPSTVALTSTVFAMTPTGLQVSRDAGVTFATVVPVTGLAAVEPSTSGQGGRVAVASTSASTVWIFDPRTSTVALGPTLPGTEMPLSMAFVRPGELLVVTQIIDLLNGNRTVVSDCMLSTGQCTTTPFPEYYPPTLVPSPAVATDGTVLAYGHEHLWKSVDWGRTFHLVSTPPRLLTGLSVAATAGGLRVVLASADLSTGTNGSLALSEDGGASFHDVTGSLPAASAFRSVLALPDGTMIVGLASGGAPRCSTDGGAQWLSHC